MGWASWREQTSARLDRHCSGAPCSTQAPPTCGAHPLSQIQPYTFGHITCTLSKSHFFGLRVYPTVCLQLQRNAQPLVLSERARIRAGETTQHEISVNVTTMIKYLLPGTATTNTSVLRPETLGSTLLLAVFVTIVPSSVTTAVAVALRSANGSWPSRASSLFVGCGDNFSREVQPDRARQYRTTRAARDRHTIHGGTRHPRV